MLLDYLYYLYACVFVLLFSSFLLLLSLGLRCGTIFPSLKLLVNQHRTWRISKEFKGLEAQINGMRLSADCSEIWNISSKWKRNPGWTFNIMFAIACTPYNSTDNQVCLSVHSSWQKWSYQQEDKLCARPTVQFQSNKARRCHILRKEHGPANPVSCKKSTAEILRWWIYMVISPHLTMRSFCSPKPSLPQQDTLDGFQHKPSNRPQYDSDAR